MQTEINNDVHLAQAVTSHKQSGGGIKSIDILTDFDEILKKIGKIDKLLKSSMMDDVVTKHLTGMDRLRHQGLIYFAKTIRDIADTTLKDLQTEEFKIKLPVGQCMNLNSVHLCFLIKVKKNTAKTKNIDVNMIIINNFFTHWTGGIEEKRRGDDLQILSSSAVNICRYSDRMLSLKRT